MRHLAAEFRSCATLDHGQRWASCGEQRLGFGCGVNAASIMRRWPVRSLSFCGDRMLQATSCAQALAVLAAAAKARPSNGQAGPAITSASVRFRLTNRSIVFRLAHGFG